MLALLSAELDSLLSRTFADAASNKHKVIHQLHVLAALVDAESLSSFWKEFQVDEKAIRLSLSKYKEENQATVELHDNRYSDTHLTLDLQRLLLHASLRAQSMGSSCITSSDLLLVLLSDKNPESQEILQTMGVSYVDVVEFFESQSEK